LLNISAAGCSQLKLEKLAKLDLLYQEDSAKIWEKREAEWERE